MNEYETRLYSLLSKSFSFLSAGLALLGYALDNTFLLVIAGCVSTVTACMFLVALNDFRKEMQERLKELKRE